MNQTIALARAAEILVSAARTALEQYAKDTQEISR